MCKAEHDEYHEWGIGVNPEPWLEWRLYKNELILRQKYQEKWLLKFSWRHFAHKEERRERIGQLNDTERFRLQPGRMTCYDSGMLQHVRSLVILDLDDPKLRIRQGSPGGISTVQIQ